ncbi:MAG: hypothetical protein ACOX25_10230 [Caldicoprobacterales bacterium]|jgi:hypothetical protein|nr:hypothetical protein [Clostridiales bacterium]
MQNDTQDIKQHPEKQAEHLIGELRQHYAAYLEKNHQHEQSNKSFGKLFEKWFRGSSSHAMDSMHEDFLNGIDRIVGELIIPLQQLQQDAPDLCCDLAEQAVSRMVAPKVPKNTAKSTAEWFMTVAEYKCSPLLPFLRLEALERFRGQMFEVSRRLMFPKEREFFDQFEEVLKAKRAQE